ncbi:MAG TPA: radical SAM protein [Methanotrichaceae archaeon]|mgnify:CR=1 FL=1|nr:radical SAM protein [Methanotrichaceae archaeon]
MKFTLGLTHNCNLSCKYCYSGRKFKKDMSLNTAQKIVDFAMDVAIQGQVLDFSFFGGEPFLCFDLMKDITSYIRERERDVENPVRLSVTTNGTILNQSIFDFLKEENVDLCISIDGPEYVHDLNRCYEGGTGSFAQVLKNLKIAIEQLDGLQVNAVYGPETVDRLMESVSFFVQLGISVVHLNPNIFTSWPEDAYPKLNNSFMKIADYYVQSYEREHEIAINLIDSKIVLFLKGGYTAGDICGMGETEWGFAPSGNIYPCERFIGEDDGSSFCLGNIHTGLDLESRCSLLHHRGNHNEECKSCDWQKYCMNWCGCTNYHLTGHTDLASPVICASERSAIKAAKHVFTTLSGNELFIDHLYSFFS